MWWTCDGIPTESTRPMSPCGEIPAKIHEWSRRNIQKNLYIHIHIIYTYTYWYGSIFCLGFFSHLALLDLQHLSKGLEQRSMRTLMPELCRLSPPWSFTAFPLKNGPSQKRKSSMKKCPFYRVYVKLWGLKYKNIRMNSIGMRNPPSRMPVTCWSFDLSAKSREMMVTQ